MYGSIDKLHRERGFGFIARDDGRRPNVFVHRRLMRHASEWLALEPGARVAFELGQDRDGRPCAVDVHIALPESELSPETNDGERF